MSVTNQTNARVDIYWIDQQCNAVPYGSLQPGETLVQDTYAGHRWAATSGSSQPVSTTAATSQWIIS